jgi:mRNA-degrading endonuclease RelE of RelBE toxin-antitoxin system
MLITVIEFQAFTDDANRLFTIEERFDLVNFLAMNPEAGEVIRDTGGIRKVRFGLAKKGKGKRGGARVIFFYYSDEMPLAVLAVYSKSEKIDLSSKEKKRAEATR